MNKKSMLIMFVFIFIIGLMQADLVERHLLTLSKNNKVAIGISPKMWNIQAMDEDALQQASVLFTRLDASYGIDKFLSDQNGEESISAHYQYTVSCDIDQLYHNYHNLKKQYIQDIYGNSVYFFATDSLSTRYYFEENKQSSIEEDLPIKVIKKDIFAYGSAKSARLNTAFDMAFEQALLEYSKYKGQGVKTLKKNSNQESQHIMESSAVNTINQLEFSKVQIDVIHNATVLEFQVNVELRKAR
ncbi:MAG TPA: hypothetical protein PL063_06270 [Candidatus Cloacimonadota bacterium]|jgi:hypothetical protein|nr:hypothetical protein [Candidatus Cloacimonadales bacterium]HPY96799.1 hypothetical protein [Candidatus Cloacimonadota bacterium]HQB41219.1 hypothetical protein [Candidatus Cloacimonadota bacterium]